MILQTNLTAEEIYAAAAAAGARPDPLLTISQWADRYRWLSQRASAEHGRWRTERTPYLREIMDCLSPSSLIERVAFMKGAQIGGTECGNNWMGYVIHQAPGPMMSVQPTVEMAKRNSKQRIEPLIEESEVLRKLVRDPRSRDSGNTVLSKDFPGGVLVMTGANSAVGLRSMAARYLFLDEVDAYPGDVEGEGDPITLAMARTRTFARRKVFLVSTPKITGMSRIEAAYEESDQRKYWVPCPTCREFQILKFAQLRWPKGDPQSAVYVCEHCGQEIRNHPASADLSTKQFLFGSVNSSGQVALTGAAAASDGIIANKPDAQGRACALATFPGQVARVMLGGTVANGALLEVDAAGKAVTQSAGKIVAKALSAGVANDIIPALLILMR